MLNKLCSIGISVGVEGRVGLVEVRVEQVEWLNDFRSEVARQLLLDILA